MKKHTHSHLHAHADEDDDLVRFGVSMSARLLTRFDAHIARRGYTNRSEAVRDLVRNRLVEDQAQAEAGEVIGALVIVYDHEIRALGDRMTHMQHHAGHLVISTMHVHLDETNCLEVLALKGSYSAVQKLADGILSLKGVKHGRLVITGPGDEST